MLQFVAPQLKVLSAVPLWTSTALSVSEPEVYHTQAAIRQRRNSSRMGILWSQCFCGYGKWSTKRSKKKQEVVGLDIGVERDVQR